MINSKTSKSKRPLPKCAIFACLSMFVATVSPSDGKEICDNIDQLVAATPIPPQSAIALRTHLQQLSGINDKRVDLLILGDSLAAGWSPGFWPSLNVANFGIGADRTQNVLWRLSAPVLEHIRPRAVLIIIGTNNLAAADKPCAIAFGVEQIERRIISLWPQTRIFYLEIPPKGADFLGNDEERHEANASIRAIPGLTTINVDTIITCNWRYPCKNYNADNLHFSKDGYITLTDFTKSAIFGN